MRYLPLLLVSSILLTGGKSSPVLTGIADIALNEKVSAQGWVKNPKTMGAFSDYSYSGPDYALSDVPLKPKLLTCKNGKVIRISMLVKDDASSEDAFEALKAFLNKEIGEDRASKMPILNRVGATDRGFIWKGPSSTISLYLATIFGKQKTIALSWNTPNAAVVDSEIRAVLAVEFQKMVKRTQK